MPATEALLKAAPIVTSVWAKAGPARTPTGMHHNRALLIGQLRDMGFGPDTATLNTALTQGGGELVRAIAHLLDNPDQDTGGVAAALRQTIEVKVVKTTDKLG